MFFFENRQQFNDTLGKKKHVFFGNALPKSNGRAHLKHTKKKHSGRLLGLHLVKNKQRSSFSSLASKISINTDKRMTEVRR